MTQKYANAARAELASTINDTDTALEIVEFGELFPVADTGSSAISDAADWFKLTLQDDTGYEIVFVRTHTSASVNFTNILRGQEGTTAREFLAGSVVGLRPTAGDAESYATGAALTALDTAKQDRHTFTDSPPSSPVNGQVWTQGTTGIEFTWLDDGAGGGQWVELGPSGQMPALTGDLDSLAITYNVDGTIDTVTEDGVEKTFTYNGDGTIDTVSWEVGSLTRTETYSYTDGVLDGMTAVEA